MRVTTRKASGQRGRAGGGALGRRKPDAAEGPAEAVVLRVSEGLFDLHALGVQADDVRLHLRRKATSPEATDRGPTGEARAPLCRLGGGGLRPGRRRFADEHQPARNLLLHEEAECSRGRREWSTLWRKTASFEIVSPSEEMAFVVPRTRPEEIPSQIQHGLKERSFEASVRHDDASTLRRDDRLERAQESPLDRRIPQLLERMNLDVDRQRSTADRHGRNERYMRASRLRPVDENHGPSAPAKQAMRDCQEEEQPIAGHLRIAEQPVDSLDAVLRQRRASADFGRSSLGSAARPG